MAPDSSYNLPVDKYLLPITIAIVVISVVPSLLHLLPERDK